MNFELEAWLDALVKSLKETFGIRLLFAGLAGSRARGEAGPQSDIDIHIILDTLELEDLRVYREIIEKMPYSEKACGFICSQSDIALWPAGELFQFSMGCRALAGDLKGLFPFPSIATIREHIILMASAIYHESTHRYVFGSDHAADTLFGAYKSAFFVLQEWVFVNRHLYAPSKNELLSYITGDHKAVLETLMNWDLLAEDRESHPNTYFSRIIQFARIMMAI